jgi:hypothetical protein
MEKDLLAAALSGNQRQLKRALASPNIDVNCLDKVRNLHEGDHSAETLNSGNHTVGRSNATVFSFSGRERGHRTALAGGGREP